MDAREVCGLTTTNQVYKMVQAVFANLSPSARALRIVVAVAGKLGTYCGRSTALRSKKVFGALQGALVLGVVWAVVHFIPLLEAQRSLVFIAWWSLATVAYRAIITWLYNNTGRSVFVATLFHTMSNLTWQLFPINGSYYDPQVTGAIALVVAGIVAIGWGPKTLVRA